MKTVLGIVAMAVLASACGARTSDNHTGGKTSWLSACNEDVDCSTLEDAVCAARLCTVVCSDGCSIGGTTCVAVATDDSRGSGETQACLPECEGDADCERFGPGYTCESRVCVSDGVEVIDPTPSANSSPGGSTNDPTSSETTDSNPVRDLSGIVLLDTGDDGDNQTLDDADAPNGFNSAGRWYTYSDIGVCMADELPNEDTDASLYPAQGAYFTPTSYAALGVPVPPELLPSAPNNTHGLRVSGSGHEYFGAGLGLRFDAAYAGTEPGIDVQGAGYNGIRFWVYSSMRSAIIVKLQDAYSVPEGGLCEPRGPFPECVGPENCINAGAYTIEVDSSWRLYEIYFADVLDDPATDAYEAGPLMRANWAGFDVEGNEIKDILPTPDRIYGLAFQTASAEGDDGAFDFIIDNVGFIEANGPADNGNGRFAPESQ